MSRFYDLVTEHVRSPGENPRSKAAPMAQRESSLNCIKLASNENPFGPSPHAIEAMRAVLEDCNLYPDNDVWELRRKLSELHDVRPENVLVTAGLTSLLDIIARSLLGPGLNAVTSERTFIVYSSATKVAGGRLIQVPMREDRFDLDAIADAINPNTRIVFLANPNNPTGTIADAAAVDRLLARIPPHVVVVLDEAYYDFACYFGRERGVEYSHSADYLYQNQNVIVLRTFSKVHGLAGVRVGYGLGPPQLIGKFARMRTMFGVSVVAQAAALASLEDHDHVRKALLNNATQSQQLAHGIAELGLRVVPTWSNFLYCEAAEDADSLAARLQNEGVLIRPLGPWGAPDAIRVTIGTPEQNEIFLTALRKVMKMTAAR